MAHSPIFQRFRCLYQCKRSVFDALSPSLLDVVIRSTIPESPQFSSGLTMRKHSTGKYSRDFLRFFRVKISLCLSPLPHINKKARQLRMRNPANIAEHPRGLVGSVIYIIRKIAHLVEPRPEQKRQLRLVCDLLCGGALFFRGGWNACRKSANADSAFFQRKFSVSRKENSAVPYHREKEPPYFHPDFSEFLTAVFSFL